MWPWLVMPLIVLLLYYALFRVHQQHAVSTLSPESPPPAAQSGPQQP